MFAAIAVAGIGIRHVRAQKTTFPICVSDWTSCADSRCRECFPRLIDLTAEQRKRYEARLLEASEPEQSEEEIRGIFASVGVRPVEPRTYVVTYTSDDAKSDDAKSENELTLVGLGVDGRDGVVLLNDGQVDERLFTLETYSLGHDAKQFAVDSLEASDRVAIPANGEIEFEMNYLPPPAKPGIPLFIIDANGEKSEIGRVFELSFERRKKVEKYDAFPRYDRLNPCSAGCTICAAIPPLEPATAEQQPLQPPQPASAAAGGSLVDLMRTSKPTDVEIVAPNECRLSFPQLVLTEVGPGASKLVFQTTSRTDCSAESLVEPPLVIDDPEMAPAPEPRPKAAPKRNHPKRKPGRPPKSKSKPKRRSR
jgi:hypothetical protein